VHGFDVDIADGGGAHPVRVSNQEVVVPPYFFAL
jgi:hypothetical protein